MGKVVAGAMLLHIPFVVSQLSENDAKTDAFFKSVKLWSAAKECEFSFCAYHTF
jgi:hypothetical protein